MSYPAVFRYKQASVQLIRLDAENYALSSLYSVRRNQGYARKVVELALEYADKKNLTVRLIVRQYGDTRGLNNSQLEAFYSGFGFVKDDSRVPYPVSMTRPSVTSRKKHAP